MHCSDALFPLLSPKDQLQMGLCNPTMLKNLPQSKLYFTDFRVDRVRKLITWNAEHKLPEYLTHLKIRGIAICTDFANLSHLKHLEIDECESDLVLPCHLKTFIGHKIKSVSIPLSLTSLSISTTNTDITGLNGHPNLTILRLCGVSPKFYNSSESC